MIQIMIADDEPLAREELTRLISGDQDIEIVDTAANGKEILEKLKAKNVDAVFLDIDMPGMTGLEVASALSEWENPPRVVFATAYHQYAIEAFEANAIDYILKPYEPERLRKALGRVKESCQGGAAPARENLVSLDDTMIERGMIKKIVGHKKNSKDRIVIDPKDVYYFYVRYSEVLARLEEAELIVNLTLKELLEMLEPAGYAQTHKSYLVNLDKVEKVAPMFSGNFEISLKNPDISPVPLSRRYGKSIKSRLGHW